MSISETLYYDLKSDEFLGSITLPGHEGKACKAFVFMIVGLCWRRKLNKRYDFTGSSVDGAALIITEIVKKKLEVGLKPVFDMGTSNVKMWK